MIFFVVFRTWRIFLFEWLVHLTPAISSSPLAHPNQIRFTISIAAWLTAFKKTWHGLCSTWLTRLNPNKGMFCFS
jgi:sulfite reductase alpha subunit-like flavoprotein